MRPEGEANEVRIAGPRPRASLSTRIRTRCRGYSAAPRAAVDRSHAADPVHVGMRGRRASISAASRLCPGLQSTVEAFTWNGGSMARALGGLCPTSGDDASQPVTTGVRRRFGASRCRKAGGSSRVLCRSTAMLSSTPLSSGCPPIAVNGESQAEVLAEGQGPGREEDFAVRSRLIEQPSMILQC